MKKLALSFDGAPNPPGTVQVMDKLEEHGAVGTFFMEGHRIEKEPETAREVKRRGHEIGNHTYSHPMVDQIPLQELCEEIEKTDRLLKEVVGVSTKLFRPPWGGLNHEIAAQILSMGYEIALWTHGIPIYDWVGPSAEVVAQRILTNIRHEELILVFHDRVEIVPQVLELIIPPLKAQGFETYRISELGRKGIIQ